MKLLWCTDIHLDCVNSTTRVQFINEINTSNGDALLITGDIATGSTIVEELTWLSDAISCPIYFVLGNHDYYHSDIQSVRAKVMLLIERTPTLHWLSTTEAISLSARRHLIGHGGWGDAQNGDFLATPIRLNDHKLIADLTGHERPLLQAKLQELGREAATHIEETATRLLDSDSNIQEICIATHVPPYPESAWYMGYSGAIDWIPDFTCKAVGDTLLQLATEHPHIQWTVLCGHGHHPGVVSMLDNLIVHTGKADYGTPILNRGFTFED